MQVVYGLELERPEAHMITRIDIDGFKTFHEFNLDLKEIRPIVANEQDTSRNLIKKQSRNLMAFVKGGEASRGKVNHVLENNPDLLLPTRLSISRQNAIEEDPDTHHILAVRQELQT